MLFERLEFGDAVQWRRWLAEYHSIATEAWVVHHKVDSRLPGLRYAEALEVALSFGWIDGKLKSIDADTFMLRYTPRKLDSVWSLKNRLKVEQLMREGRMLDAGIAAVEAAKANGKWDEAYTDRNALPVPDSLRDALALNPLASTNFYNFPVSARNMYIRWINQAKARDKRLERTSEVVERSERLLKPAVAAPRKLLS